MRRIAALVAALALTGCMRGALVTWQTQPLTTNFSRTPVANSHATAGEGDVKDLRYNAYLRVIWDVNSIGELAKRAGMSEIYYADLQTISILGIWNQYRVRVYGKRAEP